MRVGDAMKAPLEINVRSDGLSSSTCIGRIWDKFTKTVFEMPAKHPGFLARSLYGISGSAFSWGSHYDGNVTDPKRLKESITAELTNVGILCALLLNITIVPIIQVQELPFRENSIQKELYFALWAVSSLFLAYGVLVSVVSLTHVQTYKSCFHFGNLLRHMGIFLHTPLHFLILGGLAALVAMAISLYYQVSTAVFILICTSGLFLLGVVGQIFIAHVNCAWISFNYDRGQILGNTTSTNAMSDDGED
jgi:hypothetical protein